MKDRTVLILVVLLVLYIAKERERVLQNPLGKFDEDL